MRDGYVVYHGPRSEVRQWFEKAAGVSFPSDVEEAGFLVDFFENLQTTIFKSEEDNICDDHNSDTLSSAASEFSDDHSYGDGKVGSPVSSPSITTDTMLQNYHHRSHVYQTKKISEVYSSNWMPYTKAQYCEPYPHTFLNTIRQPKLVIRSRCMMRPRLIQSSIPGLIFGTLFQLSMGAYESLLGLLLICVTILRFH